MLTIVISVIILISVLLILIVLVQDSKGGLASGNNASQIMGVKKTGDILEKLTWGFAVAIMVLCISTGFISSATDGSDSEIPTTINLEKAKETNIAQPAAPAPAPAAPAADSGAQPAADSAKK